MDRTVSAIIPAAGFGSRFSASGKKQFYTLFDHPVLYYTLVALARAYYFDEFIIGAAEEDHETVHEVAVSAGIERYKIVKGGDTRAETVLNALNAATSEYALVHDAVRPFITPNMLGEVLNAAFEHGGAICGLYSRDTVKLAQGGFVSTTLKRDSVLLAHTPQVFIRDRLIDALKDCPEATDESSAYEKAAYKVKVCASSPDNIKITLIEDIELAQILISKYFLA